MIKSQVYIILLLVSIISCKNVEREKVKKVVLKESSTIIEQKNEPKITTESDKSLVNSDDSQKNQVEQVINENTNKLILKFTKIDSTDYFSYKRKYSNGITVDSTIVNEAGSSFTLSLKNIEKKFSCGIDYNDCTYYKGFLNSLNKYVLTYCGVGYCGTYLLDKNTGIKNYLQSPFDTECEIPSLSKNRNKLIAFSSSVFDKQSFIALYKKNIKTQKNNFKEFDSFYTSDWRIKEIIWIDNNSIALKVYDNYGKNTGDELINKRYLKAKIK